MRISDWSSDVCSSDLVVVLYRGQVMESGSVEAVFSSPSHPYTESLLAAVHPPDPDHRPTRLAVPADGLGQNPDATPPAEGCPFAPRCHRRIGALCFERPPPLREDRKSTRLNSSHSCATRMPSSA